MRRHHKLRIPLLAILGLLAALLAWPNGPASAATACTPNLLFRTFTADDNTAHLKLLTDCGKTIRPIVDVEQDITYDLSPNGQLIALSRHDSSGKSHIYILDVSGQVVRKLTNLPGQEMYPRWSPDGNNIAFDYNDSSNTALNGIYAAKADGSGARDIAPGFSNNNPSWSPDGTHVAFAAYDSTHKFGIWVMNSDGTNPHLIISDPNYANEPTWSPDGQYLLFTRANEDLDAQQIWETDLSGNANPVTQPVIESDDFLPVVDSNWVMYFNRSTSAGDNISTEQLGTTETKVLLADGAAGPSVQKSGPSTPPPPGFPPGSSAPTAPTLNGITVATPKPTDKLLTRSVSFKLAAGSTAAKSYDYGWASSATATKPSSTLQHSSSANGTLDYRPTNPNQDWYVFARGVTAAGTAGSWFGPVKVHTPSQPIAVGVGDSFTSGHHQDVDNPGCTTIAFPPLVPPCNPKSLTPNDPTYSWVGRLADKINASDSIPTQWHMQKLVLAQSGAATSQFAQQNQVTSMNTALKAHTGSWNVVGLTGGANDASFTGTLKDWYLKIGNVTGKPWAITNRSSCPDTETLYQRVVAAHASIVKNLRAVVQQASLVDSSVRVALVDYPYVVATNNVCFGNVTTNGKISHGIGAVIDTLDGYHGEIQSANISAINLRQVFGASPLSSIQLTRYYGYPHPNAVGQTSIANSVFNLIK